MMSTPATLVVHHRDADNVGDEYCSPHHYLYFSNLRTASFRKVSLPPDLLLLGGGNVFDAAKRYTVRESFSGATHRVAWGIGLPQRGRRDDQVTELASQFSLFSTRNSEWEDVYPFVPCASCLAPGFDNDVEITNDVVFFLHRRKTPVDFIASLDRPYLMNTSNSIESVIAFLASAETVVTNSYHGTYWGQLLGRKVVCIPYGRKFETFRNRPTYATFETWEQELETATRYPSDLTEYRERNMSFLDDVLALLEPCT